MIRGVTVQLLTRTKTGTDAFGVDTYTETPVNVANVLVGQPTADDLPASIDLTKRKAIYILGIPKGDTHDWENCRVILPAPFAGTYQAIKIPTAGIPANVPTPWNMKVTVERCG